VFYLRQQAGRHVQLYERVTPQLLLDRYSRGLRHPRHVGQRRPAARSDLAVATLGCATTRARLLLAGLVRAHVDLVDQLPQRRELVLVDEVKLAHEQHEVAEARVQVRLRSHLLQRRKVQHIHVGVDAEEPLENTADDRVDVGRERLAEAYGEYVFVVQGLLCPTHHVVDVLWRRAADRPLDAHSVGPLVLEARSRAHRRAARRRAHVGQHAVQERDLVVKVGDVHGEPIVQVLALRKLDSVEQPPSSERRVGVLVELEAARARYRALRLEGVEIAAEELLQLLY